MRDTADFATVLQLFTLFHFAYRGLHTPNEDIFAKAATHFLKEIAPVLSQMGYKVESPDTKTQHEQPELNLQVEFEELSDCCASS